MTIDALGRRVRQSFSPQQWIAWLTCVLTGYVVHLFAFTNLIPNSDGLSRMYDTQQMTISGRWMLHFASYFNDFTQMPAVIAAVALFFLGAAAALCVGLLGLRSRVLAGLTGAVLAAFPCLGYTFLYLFTASAYCIAIFLAVLAVVLARRALEGRFAPLPFLGAALALACAMGIYQAYAAVAISLALLLVLARTMDPESDFRGTLTFGLGLVGFLALGAALYYGILLVFLKVKGLTLLSYLGMDAASSGYPFAQLPGLILAAYKQVIAFFFIPGAANAFGNRWFVLCSLIAGVLGLLAFLRVYLPLNREVWRPLGALLLLALLPLGMDFMQILSPYSLPTPLMKYAFVCLYLALLLLLDRGERTAAPAPRLGTGLSLGCLAWAALLLVVFLNTNNLLYTASAQAHRATESYLTRLYARVEDCPDYEPGMEVVIIGAIPADQIAQPLDSLLQVEHYSVPYGVVPTLNKHIYYYLQDWLNLPVEEPDEATMLAVSRSAAFRAMPLYPAQGSVQVLDGRAVVKLQSRYTPKSDYELAYENRR